MTDNGEYQARKKMSLSPTSHHQNQSLRNTLNKEGHRFCIPSMPPEKKADFTYELSL